MQGSAMKASKAFISLEEVKRSVEHYGDVIKVDSPHTHGDVIPRPPSQTPSETLPYIQSQTLVSQSGIVIFFKLFQILPFLYLGF